MCTSSLKQIDVPTLVTLTSEKKTNSENAMLVHVPAEVYCEWNMSVGYVNACVLPFNGCVQAVDNV